MKKIILICCLAMASVGCDNSPLPETIEFGPKSKGKTIVGDYVGYCGIGRIYSFKYKGKEYLCNEEGGFIEVKDPIKEKGTNATIRN